MPTYEILRIAPQILENSHISVAKSKTGDDGQLPTGWHLLTYWHFTAGRFNCRTSAAWRCLSKRGKETNIHPCQAVNPSGIVFAFARMWEIQR